MRFDAIFRIIAGKDLNFLLRLFESSVGSFSFCLVDCFKIAAQTLVDGFEIASQGFGDCYSNSLSTVVCTGLVGTSFIMSTIKEFEPQSPEEFFQSPEEVCSSNGGLGDCAEFCFSNGGLGDCAIVSQKIPVTTSKGKLVFDSLLVKGKVPFESRLVEGKVVFESLIERSTRKSRQSSC